MILIDDMISSGDTIIKIASLLKEKEQAEFYLLYLRILYRWS